MSHKKRSTPRPETLVALLPSQGYGGPVPRITRHVFVEARECVLPSPDGDAWELIYRCEETGEERRWGTTSREPATTN